MKCPNCEVPLVMAERSGVGIDYCPQCRGVWLDRGELDKILERSVSSAPAANPPANTGYPAQPSYHPKDRHYQGKKRKSFLDDIFDF